MADVLDLAQDQEASDRAAALSVVSARSRGQGPKIIDGRPCCRECGEEIPAARVRILGDEAELCVRCAEELG